jgi:hypothetical protein
MQLNSSGLLCVKKLNSSGFLGFDGELKKLLVLVSWNFLFFFVTSAFLISNVEEI